MIRIVSALLVVLALLLSPVVSAAKPLCADDEPASSADPTHHVMAADEATPISGEHDCCERQAVVEPCAEPCAMPAPAATLAEPAGPAPAAPGARTARRLADGPVADSFPQWGQERPPKTPLV